MEEPKRPGPDLSRMYCDGEVLHEELIMGIPFKIREISGEQYTAIIDRCTDVRRGTLNRKQYFSELVKACVVEPSVDVDRLKPGPLTLLISAIENALGLSEVVQKNLLGK